MNYYLGAVFFSVMGKLVSTEGFMLRNIIRLFKKSLLLYIPCSYTERELQGN
jgi:hypothetical protein